MDPSQILPDTQAWCVDAVHYACDLIEIDLHVSRVTGICPSCGQVSARQHSTYSRTVADLPWSDTPICLPLRMRRFFCDNPECGHQTFMEHIPTTVSPHARRTKRLQEAQRAVAFALGGEGGARLVRDLKMSTSPDTLLRSIRRTPESTPRGASLRVIGIDDWAIRKGHRYGTIIINLEDHRPSDLLPDRETITVAAWLKQHPSIEMVARDRASAYADGITQGAPQAVQGADRWHLLQNLQEAVRRVMDRHQTALRQVKVHSPISTTSALSEPEEVRSQPKAPPSAAAQLVTARRAKRLHNYETVKALHEQGMSLRGIARQLHLHRKTIRRYLRADTFPERPARRAAPNPLAPFVPYLEQCWQAGCHNAMQLCRELRPQGYTGSKIRISRWATKQRQALANANPGQPTAVNKPRALSARQAAWLVVRPMKDLDSDDQNLLAKLKQVCPVVDQVHTLAQSFGQMVRERQRERLTDWLQSAQASGLDDFRQFALGLERDRDAVEAALHLPWSNGPTEGHVHRLKLIKRQMYGRANFDLLRRRVLFDTS